MTGHAWTLACPSGKRRYPDELTAKRELRAIRKNGRRDAQAGGRETRCYQCDLCHGGWHLTRQSYRPRRAA